MTIATHILANISRSKDNQAIKSGQLIEYSMRNIFLKIHISNVVKVLLPGPKKSKFNISPDQ